MTKQAASMEEFARLEAPLLPHLIRLTKAIGPAFDMQQYSDSMVARLEGPIAARYETRSRVARIQRLAADRNAPPAERSRLVREAAEGCPGCRNAALGALAGLALKRGDIEGNINFLRAALAESRTSGNQNMVCWQYGGLGEGLKETGHRDSTILLWEAGLAVAQRHRLLDHVARFHLFLANHYASEGRWALANDYLGEVHRLTLDPALEGEDVRYVHEALQFLVRLGAWELVARDLRAAGPSLRRARRAGSPWSGAWEVGIIETQAMVAARSGDVATADRLFARADAMHATVGGRIPSRGRLLARWSRALTDAGRFERAIVTARRGQAYCDSFLIPEYGTSNAVALARACLRSGDLDGCGDALASFARASERLRSPRLREVLEYEALRAQWHRARNDRVGMLASLRSGLERLESGVAAMDATPEAYTFLFGENELRDLMHELVEAPEVSLEIERRWRRASELVRASAPNGDLVECADLVAAHLEGAVLPASATTMRDGVELTYHVGDRVLRWTRGRSGTRREVLHMGPRQLEEQIAQVMEAMSRDPEGVDAPVDAALGMRLRQLSELLIPAEVIGTNASRPGTLRISADGALALLPFEALNVSRRGYRPLQEDWNVAYEHFSRLRDGSTSRNRGTILADPQLSPRLLRMRSGLEPLSHGRAEAESMAVTDPSARRLMGASATLRALEEAWQDSRYLFLAVHSAVDPGMPTAAFVPLAPDSLEPRLDREYLEVADVLAADLTGCELVVLSGCATGVPASLAPSGAPSLAQAFLDAGAGAVVRTSWPVRDDYAASIMSTFIDLWMRRGMSPEVALNEARRRLMSGPRGYRHPFLWAAYGIERTEPPRSDGPVIERPRP